MQIASFPIVVGVTVIVLGLTGCSGSTSPAPSDAKAVDKGTDPEIARNLAKLSVGDRESAEKQQSCPVSGEPLGTMGAPVKVSVEGRDVWICCDSCEEKLKGDPKKYLAKVAK